MLEINLKGKKAFVAGISDDNGFGFAIAKKLYEAGADVLIGSWVPTYNIFKTAWENKKFDKERKLKDGSLFKYLKVYPLDASFDRPENLPLEIKENKRYKEFSRYTISEVAANVYEDFGKIDILVHSLANAKEVTKPLLETSREGYLSALSASTYSFISLLAHFAPFMNEHGSALTLTYMASQRAVPKYGGGMSSAKAALESDVKMLSYEAGRKYKMRVNAISAGPFKSRAAKAVGMIDEMINYSKVNSPLKDKEIFSEE